MTARERMVLCHELADDLERIAAPRQPGDLLGGELQSRYRVIVERDFTARIACTRRVIVRHGSEYTHRPQYGDERFAK